ncbi:DUF397 domain-containing protein [Kitasatospora sp. NPDC096128]|uniref:DUF397 domain-containing protein n=1 Tax=Kitasatospora sp. NPDC096128 TaxID=3155547 RepID=UPI00331733A0
MSHPAGSAKAALYALDISTVVWLAAPGSDPADRLELAFLPEGAVALRHSANPGVVLRYDAQEWKAFLLGLADGEFDTDMGVALASTPELLALAGASATASAG